ncbi:hypothetical protein BC936DRAFT_136986 [Jimgerdemannia flammicorona]|uniref:Uncharacterized protein n=1 Tax=Jimgerdemannia flammicorona TaxID=994334 RepID=A0A433CYB7_9FUNG|nr:hypothetical protein BC936DRAFT_136986 [Jimgerdemannia flammicorona]
MAASHLGVKKESGIRIDATTYRTLFSDELHLKRLRIDQDFVFPYLCSLHLILFVSLLCLQATSYKPPAHGKHEMNPCRTFGEWRLLTSIIHRRSESGEEIEKRSGFHVDATT